MRIAQVTSGKVAVPPHARNGAEFIVSYLTEELVRRGHEVTLFAAEGSTTSAKLVTALTDRERSMSDFDKGTTPFATFAQALSLADKFDLLHSHISETSVLFNLYSPTPVIHTLHGNLSYPYTKILLGKYPDRLYVSVSNAQRAPLPELNYLSTIYNGVPLSLFPFVSKCSGSYLGFLGYVNHEKGADIAVAIAKEARLPLKIAGDYNHRDSFFSTAIAPQLKPGTVDYLGPISGEEKIKFLSEAYAILVPIQWDEPFGLVMIEAMAVGTPVIAWNRAAAPEIIVHGKTGFLVSSIKEAAEAIRQIETIKRETCRVHVEAHFSVERMTAHYEKIYRRVLAEKR
ncbi:MAG: glycosyltransferase family 4 protein [Parcubacteria group bacterium]|nr:glycosyltransferase family 4 protein [Parcubacteria group bacterium]